MTHRFFAGEVRRRVFATLASVGALAWVGPFLMGCEDPAALRVAASGRPGAPMERIVYVGTFTGADIVEHDGPSLSKGIYVFRLNEETGKLTPVQTVASNKPSFLAVAPDGLHLYCVNEDPEHGTVSSYAIDRATGELTFQSSKPTDGAYPAHLSVHPSNKWLLASNYDGGDYPVFELAADGSIGKLASHFRGEGTGPDRDRQEAPHAHQVVMDPSGRHVLGVDLGADRIHVWKLGPTGELTLEQTVAVAPGTGPRHLAFHPNGKLAFVLGELAATITSFAFDPTRSGQLTSIGTSSKLAAAVPTLPSGFTGSPSTAEIRVHPGGRFLYATNRGHQSVVRFEIGPDGRLLSPRWTPTGGAWPRGMNIDPNGRFLFVANQNGDNLSTFRIGPDGELTRVGAPLPVPTPVDIEFGARVTFASASR